MEALQNEVDNILRFTYLTSDNRATINQFLDHCQFLIQSNTTSRKDVRKYSDLLHHYFYQLYEARDENGGYPEHTWEARAERCRERFASSRSISLCPYCGHFALLHFMDYDYDCYACGRDYSSFGDEYSRFG